MPDTTITIPVFPAPRQTVYFFVNLKNNLLPPVNDYNTQQQIEHRRNGRNLKCTRTSFDASTCLPAVNAPETKRVLRWALRKSDRRRAVCKTSWANLRTADSCWVMFVWSVVIRCSHGRCSLVCASLRARIQAAFSERACFCRYGERCRQITCVCFFYGGHAR